MEKQTTAKREQYQDNQGEKQVRLRRPIENQKVNNHF
jgi:hypothetical protein